MVLRAENGALGRGSGAEDGAGGPWRGRTPRPDAETLLLRIPRTGTGASMHGRRAGRLCPRVDAFREELLTEIDADPRHLPASGPAELTGGGGRA